MSPLPPARPAGVPIEFADLEERLNGHVVVTAVSLDIRREKGGREGFSHEEILWAIEYFEHPDDRLMTLRVITLTLVSQS